MKQLCSTYSISGSIVTLTGVNVPLSQILLVSDATSGNVLYSMAGPAATSYTQGANSTIALATAPGSSDKLTVYYDDGVAVTNGPTNVSVSNFPSSTEISNDVGNPIPVSGTVTAGRNWNLAASSDSLTAAVSSLPAVSLAGNQTLTAALANGSTLSSSISNFPAVQNVSLVGDSLASIPASLTAAVSLASGQNVGVSSLPAVSGNVGITSLPSVTVSNLPVTQAVSGTISVSNFPATQPVSGTVAVSGTIPVSAASALPVSGSVSVSNFPATQPVSGTVTANTGLTQPLTDTQLRASAVPVSGAVSVSNFPATQPVSGTVTAARNWNLAASSDSLTAAVSSIPAVSLAGGQSVGVSSLPAISGSVSLANGQTLTAALVNGSTLSSSISNFPAVQNVSLVGDSLSAIPASLTSAVSLASGQNVGVSSLPAISGAVTSNPPAGSLTMTNSSVGTSSATLLAASSATKLLVVQNTSANILYVSTVSPATATNGIVLAAGQGYEFPFVPSNALYALGSAAGTTYTMWLA